MTTRVQFARPAYRKMIVHADQVARDLRTEAIGWLLGYFAPGAVTVLDSVAATRYKAQSRYGAEADPRQELEIATSYPRVVGIVGLYHSHPFRDETQHAIFHSMTDDRTLKSRASRHEDYLSVVTDGHEAEVFVVRGGRTEVKPEILESVTYRETLQRYTCDVSLRLAGTLKVTAMEGLLGAIEHEVAVAVEKALRAKEVDFDAAKRVLKVPGLTGNATRNALRVSRQDGGVDIDLEVRTEVAVYVPANQETEILTALKQEVQDDIVQLLWRGLGGKELAGPVVDLEANLGSLRVQETNPLPKKLYKPAKRALVVKKGVT